MYRSSTAIIMLLVLLITPSTILTIYCTTLKTIIVPDDYPTIATALENATQGDTIFIKNGVYKEHTLKINKSITLIGEDHQQTVIENIDPNFRGDWPNLVWNSAIEIQTNQVRVSNLQITLAGGAVIMIIGTGNSTIIEECILSSGRTEITGSNQIFTNNIVHGTIGENAVTLTGSSNLISSNNLTVTAGSISASGSNNIIISNNIFGEEITDGIMAINGDDNLVANNTLTNSVSIIGKSNLLCANTIQGNLAVVGNNNTFYGNYLQGLMLGNRINDASGNMFYHNNFVFLSSWLPSGERTLTVWEGVKELSQLDNGKEGNYWSDYNGTDSNGDGIGDTPYIIDAKDPLNFENIAEFNVANLTFIDRYPLIKRFNISGLTIPFPDWINNIEPTPIATPTTSLPVQNPTTQMSPTNFLTQQPISPQESETPGTSFETPQGLTENYGFYYYIFAVSIIIIVSLLFVTRLYLKKQKSRLLTPI